MTVKEVTFEEELKAKKHKATAFSFKKDKNNETEYQIFCSYWKLKSTTNPKYQLELHNIQRRIQDMIKRGINISMVRYEKANVYAFPPKGEGDLRLFCILYETQKTFILGNGAEKTAQTIQEVAGTLLAAFELLKFLDITIQTIPTLTDYPNQFKTDYQTIQLNYQYEN